MFSLSYKCNRTWVMKKADSLPLNANANKYPAFNLVAVADHKHKKLKTYCYDALRWLVSDVQNVDIHCKLCRRLHAVRARVRVMVSSEHLPALALFFPPKIWVS